MLIMTFSGFRAKGNVYRFRSDLGILISPQTLTVKRYHRFWCLRGTTLLPNWNSEYGSNSNPCHENRFDYWTRYAVRFRYWQRQILRYVLHCCANKRCFIFISSIITTVRYNVRRASPSFCVCPRHNVRF